MTSRRLTQPSFGFFLISVLAGFSAGMLGALVVVPHVETPSASSQERVVTHVTEESLQVVELVKQTSDAVVSIQAEAEVALKRPLLIEDFFGITPDLEREGLQTLGSGSGFVVSEDGLIITNRHVVGREDAEYTVIFNDGSEYKAEILIRDPLNDVALIKIEADNLSFLELADSDHIQIGQNVIAIGNALGEFDNSVTKGIVSGINRRIIASDGLSAGTIEGAIQTDAAINRGNSGGPLLDETGKVIGVNTAVSQRGQSIGFAIPINTARFVLDSYTTHGRLVRPWLGVRYTMVSITFDKEGPLDFTSGAQIVDGNAQFPSVIPGSPADLAGLKEGDVIISIEGETVDEIHSPARLIAQYQVGQIIRLGVFRNGEVIELEATLVELDPDAL